MVEYENYGLRVSMERSLILQLRLSNFGESSSVKNHDVDLMAEKGLIFTAYGRI